MEYSIILISIFFAFGIATIIYFISFFGIQKVKDLEKISSYECGFDPFEDARNTFEVKFYIVGILFIIFDLEIMFLFPWATVLGNIDFWGFFCMIMFLILLTIGFIYEWKKGAIDWE